MTYTNPSRTPNQQMVLAAVFNRVIPEDSQQEWVSYLDKLPAAEAAEARLSLLPTSKASMESDGWFGSAAEPPRLPVSERQPTVKAAAAVRAPAVVKAAAEQVLQVAPSNGAEMAASLGPRPGGDWFTGFPPPPGPLARAQQAWDLQVIAALSAEELEAQEVAYLMAGPRQMTEAQARAEIAGRGDSGPGVASSNAG